MRGARCRPPWPSTWKASSSRKTSKTRKTAMTTQLDDDTLQRYYDGELSPVEERAVRARVESDASAQARLAELEKLSEMLRVAADEMGEGLDSGALFAVIQSGIKKDEQAGFGGKLEVIREEWTEHRRG